MHLVVFGYPKPGSTEFEVGYRMCFDDSECAQVRQTHVADGHSFLTFQNVDDEFLDYAAQLLEAPGATLGKVAAELRKYQQSHTIDLSEPVGEKLIAQRKGRRNGS